MGFHVLSAAQRGLKCLLAIGTHVGTEVVVGAHVPPQAPAGGESPITDQTLERLEAGVRSDVCLEHSRGDEASSTLRTFERLLACVRPAKNECFDAGAASGSVTIFQPRVHARAALPSPLPELQSGDAALHTPPAGPLRPRRPSGPPGVTAPGGSRGRPEPPASPRSTLSHGTALSLTVKFLPSLSVVASTKN